MFPVPKRLPIERKSVFFFARIAFHFHQPKLPIFPIAVNCFLDEGALRLSGVRWPRRSFFLLGLRVREGIFVAFFPFSIFYTVSFFSSPLMDSPFFSLGRREKNFFFLTVSLPPFFSPVKRLLDVRPTFLLAVQRQSFPGASLGLSRVEFFLPPSRQQDFSFPIRPMVSFLEILSWVKTISFQKLFFFPFRDKEEAPSLVPLPLFPSAIISLF